MRWDLTVCIRMAWTPVLLPPPPNYQDYKHVSPHEWRPLAHKRGVLLASTRHREQECYSHIPRLSVLRWDPERFTSPVAYYLLRVHSNFHPRLSLCIAQLSDVSEWAVWWFVHKSQQWEVEVGRSQVWGQSGLHCNSLSQETKQTKKPKKKNNKNATITTASGEICWMIKEEDATSTVQSQPY